MGERIQPGGRVDEDVYNQFKKFVQRQHGQVRGALGEELEKAMRERMNAVEGTDRMARIEDDIATIKACLADSDGGTVATPAHLRGAETHTHTEMAGVSENDTGDPDDDDIVPDTEPHHRASSRRDRAAWLFGRLNDEIGESGEIYRAAIETMAAKTWGYDRDGDLVSDLADQAIDFLDDRFDTEPGPNGDGQIVWGDHADEVWADAQADADADAADELDRLSDAQAADTGSE